jgi:hypothetical protein
MRAQPFDIASEVENGAHANDAAAIERVADFATKRFALDACIASDNPVTAARLQVFGFGSPLERG